MTQLHASLNTDTLVYTCDVKRTNGSTVWKGSAFSQCQSNDIVFLHSRSYNETSSSISCNANNIVANVTFANESSVVSQVRINVTSDIIGKTVSCYLDDGSVATLIQKFTVLSESD